MKHVQAILRTVFIWIPALTLHGMLYAQQVKNYYRGDQSVSFKWRYGYSEFPFPQDSPAALEDAQKGKFGWYDGTLWGQSYKSWEGSTLHGVQLLFRGGSPYAREVTCTSETVPFAAAGEPVSFLIPFMYTIGSEERIAFALRVRGNGEETIVCQLRPAQETVLTGGLMKVNFIGLQVASGAGDKPVVSVTGLMHIRVYPQLVAYGSRMQFDVSSVTRHMDVESSMLLGSSFKDMSYIDPYKSLMQPPADAGKFIAAADEHDRRLALWRTATAARTKALETKGRIEVACSAPGEKRDRGELRVMAYSGNPVKDFQYGVPTTQTMEMAGVVTGAIGRRFSLFRYQHHYLPWKTDDPSQLDSTQAGYLAQWLKVAGSNADTVVLDLQLSPIVKLYKQQTEMGRLALPPGGIHGAEWTKIREGYLTTLRFAKKICPALRIVQMPYELDNISGSAEHSDAHYRFFQCIYEAVADFNAGQPANDQLRVAGLGSNNPSSRWGFIRAFLTRYRQDLSPRKRLDYITWHSYLFPGHYPAMIKGVSDSLQHILSDLGLPDDLTVLVDEMGLAEPSTIEDLSDLQGAMKKESAMASFSAALQEYYDREKGRFVPVSGAGWHFALLTYGKTPVLSGYGKGMLLRSRLGDTTIPVTASPTDTQGYGLHAMAAREGKKITVLVYCASPSVFFGNAQPLNYPSIDLVLKQLPEAFRHRKLQITQYYSSPDDAAIKQILSQEKYQTLPLTRGADRYEKEFTAAERKALADIRTTRTMVTAGKDELSLSISVDAYGMRLIEIETTP